MSELGSGFPPTNWHIPDARDKRIAELEANLSIEQKERRRLKARLAALERKYEWMVTDACEELAARAGELDWSGCLAEEMRDSLEARWTARTEEGGEDE
jgi:hypothetical protein